MRLCWPPSFGLKTQAQEWQFDEQIFFYGLLSKKGGFLWPGYGYVLVYVVHARVYIAFAGLHISRSQSQHPLRPSQTGSEASTDSKESLERGAFFLLDFAG